MRIGVPTEIKDNENRVGLIPSSIYDLTQRGHEVFVQEGAGQGIGLSSDAYAKAGATIVGTAAEVFKRAEMIVKVKEPQPSEFALLRKDHTIFTFLHLAPVPEQAAALLEIGCTGIAYETVTDPNGGLPLLTPSSEVAGRLAIQAGAHCLEKAQGGRGILLGGVPGVAAAHVMILGGGVSGSNALAMAVGMGARVSVLDRSLKRLKELDAIYQNRISTYYSDNNTIEDLLVSADLVVGAVLIPGASTPKLVRREHLKRMQKGSVLVDISIDQGGCFESSRPTSYSNPTFVEEGVIHYCVANMPGGVPRTSTFALNHATLPFMLQLADKGYQKACLDNPHLLNGLNVHAHNVVHEAVAKALGKTYVPARESIA